MRKPKITASEAARSIPPRSWNLRCGKLITIRTNAEFTKHLNDLLQVLNEGYHVGRLFNASQLVRYAVKLFHDTIFSEAQAEE